MTAPMPYDVYVRLEEGGVPLTLSVSSSSEVDPEADLIILDPLTHVFGWESDLIPGAVTPTITTVTLAARTAALLPDVVEGDSASVSVYSGQPTLGTTTTLVDVLGLVSEARIQLDARPSVKYPARLTLTIVDDLARAVAMPVSMDRKPGVTQQRWRERWGHISAIAGYSIGCPTGWPNPTSTELELGLDWGDGKNLAQIAAEMCNSYAVNGVHHTLVPTRTFGYPSGYEWVGPTTWVGPEFEDPDTFIKFLLVPASRYDPAPLPQATISARYCTIPATARRGREHDINAVTVGGRALPFGGPYDRDTALNYTHLRYLDLLPGGTRTRVVPTQLATGYTNTEGYIYPAPDAAHYAGQVFITDNSAIGDKWVFDQVVIRSSDLPEDEQANLGRLTQAYGSLVHRLTITDLPERIQIDGPTVSGFIARGSLVLEGGRFTHTLALTPGDFTATDPHEGWTP